MQKRSEFRTTKFEARVDEKQEGGKKLVLRGYGILFNTEAICYDFWAGEIRETIEPTALQDTDLTEVYLIGGHNIEPDKVIARAGINLRLEVDETGLFFEAEMPNTQYARDIYNLVEAGIVDGMSFGFESDDEIDYEKHTRTITKISKLYEISITPFPAYKEASVIAQKQRQVEEDKQKELEAEKAKVEEEQARTEAENKEKNLKELEDLLDD